MHVFQQLITKVFNSTNYCYSITPFEEYFWHDSIIKLTSQEAYRLTMLFSVRHTVRYRYQENVENVC
jgi:hypothetical protein